MSDPKARAIDLQQDGWLWIIPATTGPFVTAVSLRQDSPEGRPGNRINLSLAQARELRAALDCLIGEP
jgi:hypothetical protein